MLGTDVLVLFERLARKDSAYNEGNRLLCSYSIMASPRSDNDSNAFHPESKAALQILRLCEMSQYLCLPSAHADQTQRYTEGQFC